MKKLIMSVPTLLLSLIAFSQTGTVSITKLDTSKISLPKIYAVRIAQDLIRYDSTKAENAILKNNIELYKSNIESKDKRIQLKEKEIDMLNIKQFGNEQIISMQNSQLAEYKTVNKDLTKELRKRTVQRDILGGTAIALVITVLLVLR